MSASASLPMYNLPEMRSANAQFWGALRGLLLEAGLGDVPETLVFERGPVPARLEAEMLFSQTCGYPLETVFKGQALRLGAPVYDVPGCAGATHRAFFLVRADFPARRLDDLRGGVFLLNSPLSNSGMNLPRRALAEIAGGKPVFRQVIETGGHPASLDRLLRGEGDVASIDCVTYAFWRHYRPERRRGCVSWPTPTSPSIPFVTSVATPAATVTILRTALHSIVHEERYRAVREGLMLADIVDVPEARYRALLDYRAGGCRARLSGPDVREEMVMDTTPAVALKDRIERCVAQFADRREDWAVFGFETARDPRYARAQRRHLGASGSVDPADLRGRDPGNRVHDVDPDDAAREPHPDALPRDRGSARSRTAPSPTASDRRSEFEHPTANAFVGEVEATLGKQLFDIAIAQGEAKVQPHGVLDDDRRKTMPAIGDRSHARSLRRTYPIQQVVFLTMPIGLPRAKCLLPPPHRPRLGQ